MTGSCTPLYFGAPERRLFGLLHLPDRPAPRAVGVVLCGSFGHEAVRSHRAFKTLADSLRHAGFPVLRFDYYGAGDSGGEGADVSVAGCLRDIAQAIEELTTRGDAPRVVLVGLRLGAALAAMAVCSRNDVDDLILWDPVLDGNVFVRQLLELHRRWVETLGGSRGPEDASDNMVIGFPLSPALRAELEQVDEPTLGQLPVKRLAVFSSALDVDDTSRHRLESLSRPLLVWHTVQTGGGWDSVEFVQTTLAPHALLQRLVAFVAEAD